MFHRRLKWFAVLLSVLALAVVGRLVDVQIVSASQYEALADRLLTRPVRYLRAPRGEILDRSGRPLVRDIPASDISVHFRALAGKNDYLYAIARKLKQRGRSPEPIIGRRAPDGQLGLKDPDAAVAVKDVGRAGVVSARGFENLIALANRRQVIQEYGLAAARRWSCWHPIRPSIRKRRVSRVARSELRLEFSDCVVFADVATPVTGNAPKNRMPRDARLACPAYLIGS